METRESEILLFVESLIMHSTPARIAWNKAKSKFGQNPFEGRNSKDRRASFEKLYSQFEKFPVARRAAILNAQRKEFLSDMNEAAMAQDVPAEDVESYASEFQKAAQYPAGIPDALELLAEFDAPRAKALLERARSLWSQLNVQEIANAET